MRKILLIGDAEAAGHMRAELESAGFLVAWTPSAAIEGCKLELPDLLVVDQAVTPDVADFHARLRAEPLLEKTPLILLADHFERNGAARLPVEILRKPVFPAQVALTARALLSPSASAGVMQAGDMHLDRMSRKVFKAGREVRLTATEFRLLEFLMSSVGVVFSREQILNAVWSGHRSVTARTVDVCIARLRRKIGDPAGDSGLVRSVRLFGYSAQPAE